MRASVFKLQRLARLAVRKPARIRSGCRFLLGWALQRPRAQQLDRMIRCAGGDRHVGNRWVDA